MGIDGDIGRSDAIRDREHEKSKSGREAFDEEEAVERDRRTFDRRFLFSADTRGKNETYGASENSDGKDSVKRKIVVKKKSDHRAESHSNVVGKTIVAKTFATALRRHDVDDYSVASDSDDAKHQTLKSTDNDDHKQRYRNYVATKK